MTKIKAVRIDWYSDYEYEQFREVVSETKRLCIDRYKNRKDYQRTLLGDVLARNMLGEFTLISSKDLIIDTDENGKPFAVNASGIYFNISHSGDWVVCVVSDKQCGIDVEKISDIDIKVAERFFTPNEYAILKREEYNGWRSLFFEFWTIKESYIKYVGKGLKIPLNSFEIVKNNRKYAIKSDAENVCNVEIIEFEPEYKMAISYMDGQYQIDYKRTALI
jgi:4'-phosphopantetheinyl transferase